MINILKLVMSILSNSWTVDMLIIYPKPGYDIGQIFLLIVYFINKMNFEIKI